MLQVHSEPDIFSHKVKFWFYIDTSPPQLARIAADGPTMWVEVREGDTPRPSLTLDQQMIDALIRESAQYAHPADATAKHLNDAVVVRDRLLTLVEGFAHPPRIIIPGETHGKE